jgi:hypothetical protein
MPNAGSMQPPITKSRPDSLKLLALPNVRRSPRKPWRSEAVNFADRLKRYAAGQKRGFPRRSVACLGARVQH